MRINGERTRTAMAVAVAIGMAISFCTAGAGLSGSEEKAVSTTKPASIANADEAIGGADRSRQEIEAVDALPVGVDRELLIEGRRIGHHRIFAVVVDDEFAGDIFEDRAVTRSVRERKVTAGLLSTGLGAIGFGGAIAFTFALAFAFA